MDVGIGLPNTVPGATGAQIVEWARRAEARGFSTLGTVDRFAYANYEPIVALSAAADTPLARMSASVTDRSRLAKRLPFSSSSSRWWR